METGIARRLCGTRFATECGGRAVRASPQNATPYGMRFAAERFAVRYALRHKTHAVQYALRHKTQRRAVRASPQNASLCSMRFASGAPHASPKRSNARLSPSEIV